ncbi:hypothetical protein [Nocardia sp. NPDC047038]|uniref:hypothetical protein n=1 Tax=Nocardia sp. NPDC047038 TaxID=3154338 RepID=UPI0033F4FE09
MPRLPSPPQPQPPQPVEIRIDHTALAYCLHNAAWLPTVPTTTRDWNLRWRRTTRRIIDELVTHGGVFAANLPSDLPVTVRYDDLTDPVGVQVWAQTGPDDTPGGVRLATVEYSSGLHYAADTTIQAEAVNGFLTDLLCRRNDDLRAVLAALTPHHRPLPTPMTRSKSNWWWPAIPTPLPAGRGIPHRPGRGAGNHTLAHALPAARARLREPRNRYPPPPPPEDTN